MPKRKPHPKHDWQEKFFEEFEATANLKQSALAAGITRDAVYKRKYRDEAFAARLEDAEQEALEKVESVLMIEAQHGDTRTAQWILARRKPEKWGDPVMRAQIQTTSTDTREIVLKFADGTPCPPLPAENKK